MGISSTIAKITNRRSTYLTHWPRLKFRWDLSSISLKPDLEDGLTTDLQFQSAKVDGGIGFLKINAWRYRFVFEC